MWEFNRLTNLLEYKTEEYGIFVDRIEVGNVNKTRSFNEGGRVITIVREVEDKISMFIYKTITDIVTK